MSNQRLVWTKDEYSLLISTRHELPEAKLEDLTDAFNKNQSNKRKRSPIAVRAKLRLLGLRGKPKSNIRLPMTPANLGGLGLLNRRRVSIGLPIKSAKLPKESQWTYIPPPARYDWSVPELGFFLPLNPLIADARHYAAYAQTPGYCEDLRSALPWLTTFGADSISKLKCTEKDKLVLQQYMDHLTSLRPSSSKSNMLESASMRGDGGGWGVQNAVH